MIPLDKALQHLLLYSVHTRHTGKCRDTQAILTLMLLEANLANTIDRLGYPVSDIEIGIGDDDVTIECVDVIVSRIARLCGVLNTRDKLAVSRKY